MAGGSELQEMQQELERAAERAGDVAMRRLPSSSRTRSKS